MGLDMISGRRALRRPPSSWRNLYDFGGQAEGWSIVRLMLEKQERYGFDSLDLALYNVN
jgi:hypothetical protein